MIEGDRLEEVVRRVGREYSYMKLNPAPSVYVFYGEKYYLRVNSNLMITIVFSLSGDGRGEVDILTGGGGPGLIGFGVSFE